MSVRTSLLILLNNWDIFCFPFLNLELFDTVTQKGSEILSHKIMISWPHFLETNMFDVHWMTFLCLLFSRFLVSVTINDQSQPVPFIPQFSSVLALSWSDLCLCLLSNCVIQLKLLERNVNRQRAVLLSSSRKQNVTELRTPWKLLYTVEGLKLIPLTFTCRRQKQDSFPVFRTSTRS